jgi:hypothetical protein
MICGDTRQLLTPVSVFQAVLLLLPEHMDKPIYLLFLDAKVVRLSFSIGIEKLTAALGRGGFLRFH